MNAPIISPGLYNNNNNNNNNKRSEKQPEAVVQSLAVKRAEELAESLREETLTELWEADCRKREQEYQRAKAIETQKNNKRPKKKDAEKYIYEQIPKKTKGYPTGESYRKAKVVRF